MPTPEALIVGAGPTGMTAAIELLRSGISVRIVDISPHLVRHSQALAVQARTLEQFQRYGIAAQAVARGRKLTRAKVHSDGKQILTFRFEGIPSRYPYLLFIPQAETETILNAHMESLGVHSEREVELIVLDQQPDADGTPHPIATLRHPDGREETITPRWVIGCDGSHSAVRRFMNIPFEGTSVPLSFILGDLEVEGPDAPTDEASLHFHHGDVVFMGRLTERLTRLIIASHDEQSAEGVKRTLTPEDFQRGLDKAKVKLRVHGAEWMTPFRVNDRQAKQYRIGNVFLAGDASHIHSPVGGQGMNTGIQDAANLAWKLSAVHRGAADSLLDSYQAERGAVGEALLRFTERGLKLGTTINPIFEKIRDTLLPFATQMRPIQMRALGFVSETAIEYRKSPVIADHGGDGALHAGDRMPDVTLDLTSSILADWQQPLHLAILLNPSAACISQVESDLRHARILTVRTHQLDDAGHALLGEQPKLFILRPDGYIGLRVPLDARGEWLEYARQDAIA